MADLFFSEYVEGSSNNKALEIYNSTGAAVDLAAENYVVQTYFNGNTTAGSTINLTGTVANNDVFVLAQSSASSTILAQADQTTSASGFNGDDAILLRKGGAGGTIVDAIGQIGVDPGTEWGSRLTSTADNTLRRKSNVTTGDTNPNDAFDPSVEWDGFATDTFDGLGSYTAGSGTPGGGSGTPSENTTPGNIRIHDIQGAAQTSPLAGQTVTKVPGIVTATRSNGFYLQDPSPDNNDATSEGIFVFTSSRPTVSVGASVLVSGTVSEFRPGGSGGTNNLSTTQIGGNPTIITVSSGNSLPTATVLGNDGRTIPNTVIEDDASGNVETSNTFDPVQDGIDFYESVEGMLVQVNNAVAVGPTNDFGEIPVLADNGTNAGLRTARGGIVIRPEDFNPERIIIDDAITSNPPSVNVSDTFNGSIIGVIDYSFGNFKLLNTAPLPNVTPGGLTRETTNLTGDTDQLTVATFNVENLDPGDGSVKFNRLADAVVNNLQSPDIISLEEVQDNNGPTNDSIVDANQTYQTLINAIATAGGPTYEYRQINPVDDQDGGEPGGNIRVGFLFNPNRVDFVERPSGSSTTNMTVNSGAFGPELSASPGRLIDTDTSNGDAFANSRKPLVGEFLFNGETVFVIGNHFNSKGGDQPLFGRFQPPELSSEAQRVQQAEIVNNFVESILAADPNANIAVVGDLNDFQFSRPIETLEDDDLNNLIETLPLNEQYTYVFEGNSQVLDHILVSDNLQELAAAEIDVVHINAEFADQVSDHDPLVSRFDLDIPNGVTWGTANSDTLAGSANAEHNKAFMASTQEQKSISFASFNASLNRNSEGELIKDLSTKTTQQAQNIAEIIQRTNPDVVLINEFDYDANDPAALFQQNYLAVSQNGATPVNYPYRYVAPSNTGIASGFDLDNNGSVVTAPSEPGYGNDAFGFGNFPGQYGMVLYSKYPIDTDNIRTFQNFLWKDMPNALLPDDPATPESNDWYSSEELEVFRLSSKSHWDIPIQVDSEIIHVLASHPTPPVFDGLEDRNGRRNHDEIRFWADYIVPGQGSYIYDDAGNFGGLAPNARFVIMGDQNADPLDGDSTNNAILQLLDNPLVNTSVTPDSEGGPDAAARQDGINDTHLGNPAFDTADFADTTPGNLRADYVLPSQNLKITDASVFWPKNEDPLFRLVGDYDPNFPAGPSSDHRLVSADVKVEPTIPNVSKKTVADIEFLGDATFETGFTFNNTEVGGLSGITYDAFKNVFYSISDERSQNDPARFYTLSIDISDGNLQDGDVTFQDVTTLLNENGESFPELSIDPEGIAFTNKSTLFISSEGDASQTINPFVNQFSLQGQQFQELPVPDKFLPSSNGTTGIRNNLAFESLTITPNNQYLFTATESALVQDGPTADLENGSPARIIKYNLRTGQPEQEFVYITDPVAAEPVPSDQFSTNGLVDLLALDNNGTLLALERSFSTGIGNTIKLYQVETQGAVDVSSVDNLTGLEIDPPAEKRLLLDFADLGITLDNIEGITFGPQLPDGRQSLVVVSDNNFSDTQITQFLTFAVDLNTVPGVLPTVETPQVIDQDEPPVGQAPGDADDPAIYVHPNNSSLSLVISTLKDGGLAVYDLNGKVLQTILPGNPGDVRYNNVDLLYGFNLGSQSVDLAVASDRKNDTLAIFKIDPNTRQLTDITADNITKSIFGVDNGEQTAYGLATYLSPFSGESYVFVSQRETGNFAQLELVDNGLGEITATPVRSLTLPIPQGGQLEEAQIEGMVVDKDLGYLYVGQEQVGIWKFSAEPNSSNTGVLIEAVKPAGSNLEADVEGLTIYYTGDDRGYLLASSQGDNSFAVYSREGNNEYIGSFVVGKSGSIDAVQESDGADVVNVRLGSQFPSGLLVVQDGSKDPGFVVEDDGEIQNISTNFKFVPWENVANAFPNALNIDAISFNPRLIQGTAKADQLTGTFTSDRISGFEGNDTLNGLIGNDLLRGGTGNDTVSGGSGRDRLFGGDGIDTLLGYQGSDVLGAGRGNDFLNGGTGNDTLQGGVGQDTLIGGSGSDLFVLRTGQGTDEITDFKVEQQDKIGLSGNLTFGQLVIAQGSGSKANNTVISADGQDLAILIGIQASTLDSSNFILP